MQTESVRFLRITPSPPHRTSAQRVTPAPSYCQAQIAPGRTRTPKPSVRRPAVSGQASEPFETRMYHGIMRPGSIPRQTRSP